MIIVRTPYRVSLAGGGTDAPAFFRRRPALVVSVALDRHLYVSLTSRFDDRLRVAYTRTEMVAQADAPRLDLPRLGALFDEGWRAKRTLGAGITNPAVDALYDAGKTAGAWGGKLLGAGGGGFLLFLLPAAQRDAALARMGGPPALPFRLDTTGSVVVHDGGRRAP